jgi:hypothetical protein
LHASWEQVVRTINATRERCPVRGGWGIVNGMSSDCDPVQTEPCTLVVGVLSIEEIIDES